MAEPFGLAPNALALDAMTRTIERSVLERATARCRRIRAGVDVPDHVGGGTSRRYVDFEPAPGGRVGRFLHDPDSYAAIADDFDGYLRKLIDDGDAFVIDFGEE